MYSNFLTKESLPSVVVTLSLLKYIYGTRLKNPLKRNRTMSFLVYMVGVKATSKVDEMKSDRTRVTTQFFFNQKRGLQYNIPTKFSKKIVLTFLQDNRFLYQHFH